jgi:hypothetical protein
LPLGAAAGLVLAGALGNARLDNPPAEFPALLGWTLVSTCGWAWGWRQAAVGGPVPLAVVLGVAAVARFVLLCPAAPLSDDLYRYIWDGRVANAGYNPFLQPPDAESLSALRDDEIWPRINHPDVPTIYPPVAQLVFRALAAAPTDARGPRILAALADLLTSVCLARLLRRRGRAAGLVVAHAWCPLAISETARGGHIDAVGAALMVGGLLLFHGAGSVRRAFASGLAFGLSALVKPVAVVLGPALLCATRSNRAPLFAGAVLSLLLWTPYLDAGQRVAAGFFAYAEHWEFNDALYSLLVAAGATPRGARIALSAVLSVFVVVAARRVRDPVGAAGLMMFALFVFSPTVHPWYGIWLAAVLPVLPRWAVPGIAAFCALLPVSYATAWVHATTGLWIEPVWPRALLWVVALSLLLIGALRRRPVSA